MSPFAGFDMPIQYSSITDEHNAVRNACGMFDVSHMGEIVVNGKDAERFVQYIFTNDISNAEDGQVFYGMMCREDGGTVDDLLVYKMAYWDFILVVNAANIDKDWAWIQEQAKKFEVILDNRSDRYAQLAIQGPEAEDVISDVLTLPVCRMIPFYHAL